jgi:N12 class adenine-specific DNA methylase
MAAELREDVSDLQLSALRSELNRVYDAFRQKNGYINDRVNRLAFRDDPALPLLESLEPQYQPAVSKEVALKQNVPSRAPRGAEGRHFQAARAATVEAARRRPTSAKEALVHSLNMRGAVDLDYMAELYGKDAGRHREGASRRHLPEPAGGVGNRRAVPVGQRQGEARRGAAARLNRMIASARTCSRSRRSFRPTSTRWTSTCPRLAVGADRGHEGVHRTCSASSARVQVPAAGRLVGDRHSARPTEAYTATWGTKRMPADAIIAPPGQRRGRRGVRRESELRRARRSASRTRRKPRRRRSRPTRYRAAFKDWIWTDPERRKRLARLYNDTYNTNRTRDYDGSHLTFPGMSPTVQLRKHQKGVVWRILQDRVVLLDHVVGAGKTFAVAAGVMELKRLGISRKPMLVVPNHLVRQWRDEFYRLYPNANILVPSEKDFEKKNRSAFSARSPRTIGMRSSSRTPRS